MHREKLGIIGKVSWQSGIIGNNRDPISPDFSRFFPIILNREKSGVIGSVESQFLESQLFCKFSAKCQIPDFLRSAPVLAHLVCFCRPASFHSRANASLIALTRLRYSLHGELVTK
jgi:hypothetical protein